MKIKMKRFLTSCLVIIFMVTIFPATHLGGIGPSVSATSLTYYVSPTGGDNALGTEADPWSLSKAGFAAEAGDTVILMDGEYTSRLVPAKSGTPGSPITFRAQNVGNVLFKGGTFDPNTNVDGTYPDPKFWAIYIAGKSYINIDGIHIKMQSADFGRWLKITSTTGNENGDRAHDINITNCLMEDASLDKSNDETCPVVLSYCENIRLEDNVIRELRGADNLFSIKYADKIVLDGNQISQAPHAGLGVEDKETYFGHVNNLVLRNNVFNAQWGRSYTIFPSYNVLIEGNVFSESINGGSNAGGGDELFSDQCIYRFNRIMRNSDYAMQLDPWYNGTEDINKDGQPDNIEMFITNSRFYNNVFAENPKSVFVFGGMSSQIDNNIIKNNIFYNNDNNADYVNLRYVGDYTGDDSRVKIQNNLFWQGSSEIEPNFVSYNTFEKNTLSELQSGANAQFSQNCNQDPEFADAANYNFALGCGSPAKNSAEALTTVTSPTGTDDTFTVADARYFYSGWGIPGEVGDIISVGSASNTARITAVNYETNTITLENTISWVNGADVNLAYSGDGPDMGMYEMDAGTDSRGRVSVQINTQPFKITAGNSTTLTAIVYGNCHTSSYSWDFGDGSAKGSGCSVSHTYSSAGQYAIFCTVTADDGKVYKGCSYVIVQAPDALKQPLRKCTFDNTGDDTDTDWEQYINTGFRDSLFGWIVSVDKIDTDADDYLHLYATNADKDLWAEIAPNEWNIDQYPVVKAEYKIKPGTPVAMYVRAFPSYNWDYNSTNGYRMVYLASSPACGIRTDMELIADDQWHSIQIDARAIRDEYPDVTFANAVGFKNTGTRAEVGDEWYLDDFSIEPSENLIVNPGFDYSTPAPAPWCVTDGWTGACNNYSVSTNDPHSGANCVKLYGLKNGNNLTQTVAVTPNTDYVFSFYGKVGAENALEYTVYTTGWDEITTDYKCAASSDWTQYASTFNSGSNTSVLVAIEDYADAAGCAISYMDDFDLRPLSSALEAAKAAAVRPEDNYLAAGWAVLTAALAMPEATNAEKLTKTTAINNAIEGLVLKTDLTAYNEALAAAVQADYTEESWAAYQGVVTVNAVTTENTQNEVDIAAANITAAQGSLVSVLVKKTVSAVTSSTNDGAESMTIDGIISEYSSWSGEGDGVSITYDLGSAATVSKLNIAWYAGTSQKTTYDIATSVDGITFTNVVTSAQSNGKTMGFQPIRFPGVITRYVRIIGHGNDSSWSEYLSISEVEIYELKEARNLASNPGFDDSTPAPWCVSGGWTNADNNYSVSTDDPHSGTNCIKLDGRKNRHNLTQTVAVTPNTDYILSFFGKVGVNKAIEYCACVNTPFGWHYLSEDCKCAPSSDWTQYATTFNSGSNTSVLVAIEDYADACGTAISYLDDFDLRPLTSALAAAKASAARPEDNYRAAGWAVLTTALSMPETTNAEVLAKTTAINNAIEGLVPKADMTAYNAALAAVIETDYTSESWAAYQGVVTANTVTRENTQSEVDAATANIIAAQSNLVPKADLTAYNAALAAVIETDYTPESWATYQGVVTANAVTGDNEQSEVDTATARITAAQSDLVFAPLINLITNPGLEGDYANPWNVTTYWEDPANPFSHSTNAPRSGIKGIKVNGSGSGRALSQRIAVQKNTNYTFSFYSKAEAANALKYYVSSGDWWRITDFCYTDASNSWKQHAITFNSGENTEIIVVIVDNGGSGNNPVISYMDDFQLCSSKAALAAAKKAVEEKPEADYTAESWTVLTTALAMPETTNVEVLAKTTAINNAIEGLVLKADLRAYNAALAAVKETDYKSASWAAYQAVVTANVVTKENTQGQIDAATANIIAAQSNLVPKADMTAYNAALALVETDYTTASWGTYQGVVTANVVTGDNEQSEVDTATARITAAQSDLVFAPLTNLITNPGLEGDNANPWNVTTYWEDPANPFSPSTNAPRSGIKCIKVNGASSGRALSQTIAVQKNTNYTFSFYSKAEAANAIKYYVSSGDWWRITDFCYTDASNSWKQHAITFNSGENTEIIVVIVDNGGSAANPVTSYMDDFQLCSSKAALAAAKTAAAAKQEANYTAASWGVLTTALAMPETTNAEVLAKTIAINNAIEGLVPA